MTKLICKVCGHKDLNLEPHIVAHHLDDAGTTEMAAGEQRDTATLKWYCEKFGITEEMVVGEIVHHSLLADEAKPMSEKVSKDEIDFCGVKLSKVKGGSTSLIPKVNPAYHFPEFASGVASDMIENKRVMLVGHTGCGKSSLIEQMAARIGQPCLRVNMNGQTTIGDFVGLYTVKGGETVWVDGALPLAMRNGYWLIIDELGFAESAILSVLNYVLEPNGKLTLKEKGHEIVEPHANFRLFATDNAAGCMSDYRSLYQGTNLMNEAFMDRWRVYHVDYLPAEEEAKVLAASVPRMTIKIATHLVKVANMVREAFRKEEISCTFSLRRLIDWSELMIRYRDPVKAAGPSIFSKTSRQDAEVIKAIIERTMLANKE